MKKVNILFHHENISNLKRDDKKSGSTYVRVCMKREYVCVCVCIWVRVRVLVQLRVRLAVRVRMRVRVCLSKPTLVRTCMHKHVLHSRTGLSTRTHTDAYVCALTRFTKPKNLRDPEERYRETRFSACKCSVENSYETAETYGEKEVVIMPGSRTI